MNATQNSCGRYSYVYLDLADHASIFEVAKTVENEYGALDILVNNASVAGLEAFTSGQSYAYAASKASVIKFTKMLAKQYGAEFRTNCICPGIIETPIFKTFNEENFKEKIPMKRVGKPEDVAAVVSFLASDDAAYVNGCVLTIDGGQSL